MNYIQLINNSLGKSTKILNGELTYGWKNLSQADPADSAYGCIEVQSNGWENPVFNLTFHIPTGDSTYADGTNFMNWATWNLFAKYQSDGITKTYLKLAIGNADTLFSDYSDSSSSVGRTIVPVVIKSYSLRFSPDESRDSYFWTINAQLQVDK